MTAGKRNSRYLVSLFLGLMFLASSSIAIAQNLSGTHPWRLHDALNLPQWLSLGIEQRTRYETLANQFRAGGKGGDQVLALRTNLFLEAAKDGLRFGGEFMDSRISLDDSGTPVDNSLVNTADILQLYAAWTAKNLFGHGVESEFKFGRQTLDVGSRRLIVRNGFRNTINAFTGLHFNLADAEQWQLRMFLFQPVLRLPDKAAAIRKDRHELDTQNSGTYFGGVYFRTGQLPGDFNAELYYLHLNESDSDIETRNRRLSTPGFRIFKPPAKNQFDFELESVYQFGTSRLTPSALDNKDLEHFALFQHGAIGYTFNAPWTPRLLFQYDYASGGRSNNSIHRFDTLYGGRRFELGPASIMSAFARTNINSPGYRLILTPRKNISTLLGHRLAWLADGRDIWPNASLIDVSGKSGNFLGNQLEASLTWQVLPKNLTFEVGWAHLIKGGFAKNAPHAPKSEDTDYFYVQTVSQF